MKFKVYQWLCLSVLHLYGAALYAQGVSASEVRLAVIVPLSNEQSELGLAYFKGAQACAKDINITQGLSRKIVLLPIDNINEPSESVEVTKELVANKEPAQQAFAILGYHGDAVTELSLPVAIQAKIPVIGMLSGSEAVSQYSPKDGIYHTRVSNQLVIEGLAKQLKAMVKLKLAIFIEKNASGQNKLRLMQEYAKKYNLSVIDIVEIASGEREMSKFIASAKTKQADAVISFLGYSETAGLIQSLRQAQYQGTFAMPSSVGVKQLLTTVPKQYARGVLISFPQLLASDESSELVRSYRKLMTADNAKYIADDIALEGCVAVKVFAEGFKRINGSINREAFKAGLLSKPIVLQDLTITYSAKAAKLNLGASIGMVGINGAIVK